MTRRILVPVDGSPFAEQAIPVAARMASRTDATVELVLVHDVSVSVATLNVSAIAMPNFPQVPRAETEPVIAMRADYLIQLTDRVRREFAVGVRSTLLEGSVADALADYANTNADLVAMTTHARGGISRFWLGSVTDALVRHLTKPVLLIKPSESEAAPAHSDAGAFRRVLVPLDGSALAESILDPLLQIVIDRDQDVVCRLLTVRAPALPLVVPSIPLAGVPVTDQSPDRDAGAERYLQDIAQRLETRLRVETRFEVGFPAQTILDQAADMDADLIAMATHGRGGLRRLLIGGVADKVLRGASTSVLLFRPPDVS
ncbi:MAG: universal stress protein [Gemmatimonadota bacterium]